MIYVFILLNTIISIQIKINFNIKYRLLESSPRNRFLDLKMEP